MGRCRLIVPLMLALLAGCSQKAPQREEMPGGSQPAQEDSATVSDEVPDRFPEASGEGPILPPPPGEEPAVGSEPAEAGSEPPPALESEPLPASAIPRATGSRDSEPHPARAIPPAAASPEEWAEPSTDSEADRDNIVQVFYATDRQPHLPPGTKSVEWSLFFPALVGAAVTLLMGGLMFYVRNKWIVAPLAVTSLIVTLYLGQQLGVRAQQVRRAAEFGDRTYGELRHEERGRPVLEVGVCEVTIPPDHRVGQVESPSILRLEFRENPAKHVVLQRTQRLESEDFYDVLHRSIDTSTNRQALVFIHGYNVGFDSAVKRTAQIVYDLQFNGAAVCYSWPSNAGIADYTRDESNVGWTVTQLENFLRDLAEKSGAKTIHLIAHSMGNRALLAAIERMSLQGNSPQFGQMILAAPDVDASEFRTRYAPALSSTARQVTLYASSNDRALIASTKVHGYTRAGLSGENLMVTPGVDTIDVSPIDTSLIGHSYYGDNPQLIRDLVAMIDRNLPAANREWLERDVLEEEAFYWSFREGVE